MEDRSILWSGRGESPRELLRRRQSTQVSTIPPSLGEPTVMRSTMRCMSILVAKGQKTNVKAIAGGIVYFKCLLERSVEENI